jgi:hypothetical protein
MDEIEQLAESTCKSVCNAVITELQGIKTTLSGADSELTSAWEEICVQMQSETSIYWESAYVPTILQCITAEINKLPKATLKAIWLQTEQGGHQDDEADSPPINNEDIKDYIMNHYVLPAAEDDESPNVQDFLARSSHL